MAEQDAGQEADDKADEVTERPPATRLTRLRRRTLELPDGRYLLLYSRPEPNHQDHSTATSQDAAPK